MEATAVKIVAVPTKEKGIYSATCEYCELSDVELCDDELCDDEYRFIVDKREIKPNYWTAKQSERKKDHRFLVITKDSLMLRRTAVAMCRYHLEEGHWKGEMISFSQKSFLERTRVAREYAIKKQEVLATEEKRNDRKKKKKEQEDANSPIF